MNKTLWLTDPDASAMDVLFGIAGGIISGVFLKRMCDIKNIGPVISKIALLGGYASQVKAIENAIKNEQWDQVITQTFHLTLSILALSDNCFTGETLVASENGQIRIDEIEVGDKVWAYDIFTGETELKEVLTVYVHEVDEILHLYTSCGDIDTTTNHPFYVIDRGWVAAGDLVEGDEIYLLDGSTAFVTGAELEKLDEPIKVYNFEVEDFNTYFVGDEAVLVHNYTPYNKDKPIQKHHIATNKNPDYTPGFEEIASKYGLDLDDDWNIVKLQHQGTHPWEYHDFIESAMYKIDDMAKGDTLSFIDLWKQLGKLLQANPEMLYAEFWRS